MDKHDADEGVTPALFAILRPKCIKMHLWQGDKRDIDDLIDFLRAYPVCVKRMISYILEPFRVSLSNWKQYSTEKVIELINGATQILELSEVKCAKEILFVCLIILNVVGQKDLESNDGNSVTEDVHLSSMKYLKTLFHKSKCEDLYEQSNHLISLIIYRCLQLIKMSKLVELRIASVECLLAIYRMDEDKYVDTLKSVDRYKIADNLAPKLPGLISICCNTIAENSLLNHKIQLMVLKLVTRFICVTMEDETGEDEQGDPKKNIIAKKTVGKSDGKQNSDKYRRKVADENWKRTTIEHMGQYFATIASLVRSKKEIVRVELVQSLKLLISNCARTLKGTCLPILMNALLTLHQDSFSSVSKSARQFIEELRTNARFARSVNLNNYLEENLFKLLTSIQQNVFLYDDQKMVSSLRLITAYSEFSDLKRILKSPVNVNCFVGCLLNIFQLEIASSEKNLIVEVSSSDVDYWINFKYFKSAEARAAVFDLCATLRRKICVEDFLNYLLDLLNAKDANNKCEIIFLINNIVFNKTHSVEMVDMGEIVVKCYLESELWNITVKKKDEASVAFKRIVTQKCLLLEGLGSVALCLGNDFAYLLRISLYPILERLGSENNLVKLAAFKALSNIAKALNKVSVAELIDDNLDYANHQASLELRNISKNKNFAVFEVIQIMIENCSQNGIDKLGNVIQDLLNENVLRKEYTEYFLKTFKSLVRRFRGWYCPIFELADKNSTDEAKFLEFEVNFLGKMETYLAKEKIDWSADCEEENTEIIEEGLKKLEIKREVPQYVQYSITICEHVLNTMSSSVLSIKVISLEILIDCLLVISKWENSLLPIVHKLWPPLVDRFCYDKENHLIVKYCFDLLCVMAVTSQDFIKSRTVKDVLPILTECLENTATASLLKDKGSIYRTSHSYKLQYALLSQLGHLIDYICVEPDNIRSVLASAGSYLSDKQPKPLQEACVLLYKRLAENHTDEVRLQLISIQSRASDKSNSELSTTKNTVNSENKVINREYKKNVEFKKNVDLLIKELETQNK